MMHVQGGFSSDINLTTAKPTVVVHCLLHDTTTMSNLLNFCCHTWCYQPEYLILCQLP